MANIINQCILLVLVIFMTSAKEDGESLKQDESYPGSYLHLLVEDTNKMKEVTERTEARTHSHKTDQPLPYKRTIHEKTNGNFVDTDRTKHFDSNKNRQEYQYKIKIDDKNGKGSKLIKQVPGVSSPQEYNPEMISNVIPQIGGQMCGDHINQLQHSLLKVMSSDYDQDKNMRNIHKTVSQSQEDLISFKSQVTKHLHMII
mgnify:CR=1 FL=1